MIGAANKPPLWLTSAIPLNKIPVAIEGSRLKIWECYKVKTGTTNWTTWIPEKPANVFNGPSGSAWSVSGMPMSMLPVTVAYDSTDGGTSTGITVPPLGINTQPAPLNSHYTVSVAQMMYNPYAENCKYFMRATVGGTPAQFGDNNSTTVLLTDENGWGIMCPNQECFITACDFTTQQQGEDNYKVYQYPRYFIMYFRQRYVKSPVVLADIFQDYALKQIQGYGGETQNIMEVELLTGHHENAPEGMLDSTGIRQITSSSHAGASGAALFAVPKPPPVVMNEFVQRDPPGEQRETVLKKK